MSKQQLSAGPWMIQRFVNSKNVTIAAPGPHAYSDPVWIADSIAGPNANLIAAAPDLMRLLQAALEGELTGAAYMVWRMDVAAALRKIEGGAQ